MNTAQSPRLPILVHAGSGLVPRPRRGEPVTLGVAFPRAQIRDAGWSLCDTRGQPVPVQTSVLERWPDGSTRWLLVDFQADIPPDGTCEFELSPDPEASGPDRSQSLRIDDDGDRIVVLTGVAAFHLDRTGRFLLTNIEIGAGPACIGAPTLVVTDANGLEHPLEVTGARVELAGPLRSVIRLDGLVSLSGRVRVEVAVRLHFFSGLGIVRVELSVTNPHRAHHDQGFWDLGDPGSVYFRDLAVVCAAETPIRAVSVSAERHEPLSDAALPLQIYQDSSGGEHWNSRNHVDRDGRVPLTFRGYRLAAGASTSSGFRATPIVAVGEAERSVTVSVPQFWQNFPKAVEVSDTALTLRLWPRQSGTLHELQGGECKTHTFFIGFGRDGVSEVPLAWTRLPALARASTDSYRDAGVWRPLSSGSSGARTAYRALVDAAIEGPSSFCAKRELIDEYGWRHFGDIYADHEAIREPGLVSHYNNQYDAIAGCATRFCETGDRRWWTAMNELAAHVADIDIYHCSEDRAAYNHGLFWHTTHYADAGTATHRAYSRRSGKASGGLSNEHNYTTGLLLHYFLTGCERSREVVLELAGWVLDMDDGAKGRFRWIVRGDTGMASATRETDYHGPGRGAAYSINALLDAHRLTGERRYLEKAERLIQRCVHPADDPGALHLLDAERRWSYTVFLQTVGKYLEYRAQHGSSDSRVAYARSVLVNYATWMAVHERPYLDHPEQLEYPTETWAAQDIRKAAVFEFAERWTLDADTAQRFREAADRFFDYSVLTLAALPTKALTRPVVLLLAYGFQRPSSDGEAACPCVEAAALDPKRPLFVSYRRRVMVRLAMAGVAVAGMLTGAIVAVWLAASH